MCASNLCRKLEKLQEENLAMEEELARRAASVDAGAQLVADQQRFLLEKQRVRCADTHVVASVPCFYDPLLRKSGSLQLSSCQGLHKWMSSCLRGIACS